VHAEQDALMRGAGLPADTRERLAGTLGVTFGEVERLLKQAKAGSAAMDSLPVKLARALGSH
jgi:hypothetical protein